ncbi:MAG: hypothetical protein O7E54_11615 [Planctomycetota bacterium]|nr:hypothetical protein [Planctomycetota bacterium]
MLWALILILAGYLLAFVPVLLAWPDLPTMIPIGAMAIGVALGWVVLSRRFSKMRLAASVVLTLGPLSYVAWILVGTPYSHPQDATGLGSPAPPITADRVRDAAPFHMAALRGSDVLLVFFRGSG